MKKNVFLIAVLFFLLFAGKINAQSLVCNDLVFISLNDNCNYTIIPEDILEGTLFPNCIVELDKTPPLGNGPWVAPNLGPADINKTYQVRVRHLPSGNMCWGSVKAEDKIPPKLLCDQVSLVDINGSAPLTVNFSSLNITAADNCSATTVTPATLQYDCDDLGLKVVQFTAADAYGNTATCQHTVLVTNSQSCDACVSVCPPSIVVSYNQGNNELLPAFQANNLVPFDAFGSALSDDACGVIDSTYSVDYQFGTSGTSWFSRRWFWVTATGGFPTCEQIIAFPSAQKIKVEGKIFIDGDTDCAPDAGELGVQIFPVKITKLPSGVSETIYPNADGTYSKDIFFTIQDASAEVSLVLPNNITSVCPSAISIPTTTNQSVVTFDVGLQTGGECPQLKVELGNSILRRCFTNYFSVNYCNVGLDTAYNAFVTVNLDPLIQLVASNVPYTVSGPDSLYTFQLGNVPPFYCGSFYIQGYVSCAATLGQTLCSEATIYPNTPCGGAYLGPELSASAVCEGDSVSLMLRNIGSQDMQQPENYIVVEDFIMYQDGAIQLPAGDSITIKVPSNGSTWRIETEQVPTYPVVGLVAAAIEGCGGLNTPGLINAFGLGETPIWYDELCVQVVGSYDPNDKAATPVGYSDQHFIRANEPIEYKIRFQNTGTDTAFRVVVVDTLSNFLDLNTLEAGASSHPYRLDVYPGGILHFVFDPIALPDSNVNEPASNGFLYFRIAQKADLPDGTFIENSAAIYFDFNDPVITNTVFHTVGYPFVSLPPLVFTAQTSVPSCHNSADGSIQVTMTGGMPPYSYHWSDDNLQGNELQGVSAGVYQLTVSDSKGTSQVQTIELQAPDAIVMALSATSSLANESNGSADALISGGIAPYTYLWNTGATTALITDIPSGIYTLAVTDANGCTSIGTIEVNQIILPLINTAQTVPLACFGGNNAAISLSVTGGLTPYTFQWSDPNLQGSTVENLAAGVYTVTITDQNGTQNVETFTINAPAPVIAEMGSTPSIDNLNNGEASVTASGGMPGYSFLWNTGATTSGISNLAPGVYTVIVTDLNGCTAVNSVIIGQVVSNHEADFRANIHVSPNPAKDRVLVDLSQVLTQIERLDLFASDGRLLQRITAKELQPALTLQWDNDQTSGMVMLVFYGKDGNVYTEKIVVR